MFLLVCVQNITKSYQLYSVVIHLILAIILLMEMLAKILGIALMITLKV